MKTIDRLLINAKKLKMTKIHIPPVVLDTDEQITEYCLGYDKKYGKDRWETVFITGEDDLEDDDNVRIDHIADKYKGGDWYGKKKEPET